MAASELTIIDHDEGYWRQAYPKFLGPSRYQPTDRDMEALDPLKQGLSVDNNLLWTAQQSYEHRQRTHLTAGSFLISKKIIEDINHQSARFQANLLANPDPQEAPPFEFPNPSHTIISGWPDATERRLTKSQRVKLWRSIALFIDSKAQKYWPYGEESADPSVNSNKESSLSSAS